LWSNVANAERYPQDFSVLIMPAVLAGATTYAKEMMIENDKRAAFIKMMPEYAFVIYTIHEEEIHLRMNNHFLL
jgi:hypothetical protein